jgi:hypothetical protein
MPWKWRLLLVSMFVAPVIFLAGDAGAQKSTEDNSCVQCHQGLRDPRVTPPAEKFAQDIHMAKGILVTTVTVDLPISIPSNP